MRALALTVALLAVGCSPTLRDSQFVCVTRDDCPTGFSCVGGLCVRGDVDAGVGMDAAMEDAPSAIDAREPDASEMDSSVHDSGMGDSGAPDSGLDGGVSADAPRFDGGPDADLYVVTGTTTHCLDDRTELVPVDVPSLGVELRTFDTATGLGAPLTGASLPGGTYGIAAPHADAYYLRVSPSTYVVTTDRFADLSTHVLGRQSPIRAATGTTLTLDVTNMTAWRAGDVVEVISTNVDAYSYLGEADLPTPPALGATSLVGLEIAWDGTPLVDAARGDSVRVFHNTTTTLGGGRTARVVRDTALVNDLVMVDGGNSPLVSVFERVMPNVTISAISWPTTAYEGYRVNAGPTADTMAGLHVLDYMAQPNRPVGVGQFSGSMDLFVLEADGTSDVSMSSVSFGNPFDPEDLIVQVTALFPVSYRFPGATTTVSGFNEFGAAAMMWVFTEVASPTDFAPLVAPPEQITVDMRPLDDMSSVPDIRLDHDPVVEWTPSPLLSAPTAYSVTVHEGWVGGGGEAHRTRIARFSVTSALQSIRVPAAILTAGRYYNVLVTARYEPGTLPTAGARRFSSFFHTTP